jgi:hypothetical protein
MPVERVQERIKVGVVFDPGKQRAAVRPKWFVWNNRKYRITEITYTWHNRQGEAALVHFSVSDGANLFEICMNQKTLEWDLVNISSGT